MPIECEAKLRIEDADPIRSRLESLGAANEGEHLERNWVLDNADSGLADNDILLRVRNTGGPGGVLTVKKPTKPGQFKTREEIETMTDCVDELLRQLQIVGFSVKWIYEKYRETWLWRDCVLSLDKCPEIGNFIEIEGTPDRIRDIARELGLNADDHIRDNYLALWQNHLHELGQPKRNMVFSNFEKNTRILVKPLDKK